jgi:hypothetical protein
LRKRLHPAFGHHRAAQGGCPGAALGLCSADIVF